MLIPYSSSRFERIFAGTAIVSGMSFGNGWINYVENCRFSGNGIGLEIYASANAWDITDNCFEACDIGICESLFLSPLLQLYSNAAADDQSNK